MGGGGVLVDEVAIPYIDVRIGLCVSCENYLTCGTDLHALIQSVHRKERYNRLTCHNKLKVRDIQTPRDPVSRLFLPCPFVFFPCVFLFQSAGKITVTKCTNKTVQKFC